MAVEGYYKRMGGLVSMDVMANLVDENTRQTIYKVADFVADSAVYVEDFLLVCGLFGKPRRVIKADVEDFGFAGENGTVFVGVVADGNNKIKIGAFEFVDMF
jgi:hypothetical protein